MKAMTPLLACIAVSVGLAVAYVAFGGLSYEPTAVADPCAPRPQRETTGTGERIEVVLLAAADQTACELGVSREDLVIALRSVDELDDLAEREGRSRDDLEDALRAGLVRAVDDAEKDDLIGRSTAGALTFAAERLPLGLLLSVLRGASSFLD